MDLHLLQKAAANGDVASLRAVLLHNSIALHEMLATTTVDTPLLIAAALGHHEFVKEIMSRMPNLARQSGKRGAYPLHMAAASGHVRVVAELLEVGGQELCRLRDKDGRMPIHIAATRLGEVGVFEKLTEADPDSLQEVTGRGETVLHLSVKAHQMNVVKFLSARPDFGSLLNVQDEQGNTALHLAAAGKSTEISKVLLGTPGIQVNAKNSRDETAIDVLPLLSNDALGVELGQIILAAGGSGKDSSVEQISQAANSVNHLQISKRNCREYEEEEKKEEATPEEWLKETRSSLMVVAALIANITFQAGVNPPGGFYEPDPTRNSTADIGKKVGKTVLAGTRAYHVFLVADFLGLFSALCVILLSLSKVIRNVPILMNILVAVMSLSIISTGTAFLFLVSAIIPKDVSSLEILIETFLVLWFVEIFYLAILWKARIWFDKYFLEKLVGVHTSTPVGRRVSMVLCFVLAFIISITLLLVVRSELKPRLST